MIASEQSDHLKSLIRNIPDYPKPGVMFRDVTTLMGNAEGMRTAVDCLVDQPEARDVDVVAGIEARGFILGGAVAHQLGKGFVPVRKKGKLPWETISEEYELEYGVDAVEMHADALSAGQKVLLVDDLIATGGTARAAVSLIARSGAFVPFACFIIELPDLGGREVLEQAGVAVRSLVSFEGD